MHLLRASTSMASRSQAEFTSATSSGSTNTGIVSTLGGIKEDLVNEMKARAPPRGDCIWDMR